MACVIVIRVSPPRSDCPGTESPSVMAMPKATGRAALISTDPSCSLTTPAGPRLDIQALPLLKRNSRHSAPREPQICFCTAPSEAIFCHLDCVVVADQDAGDVDDRAQQLLFHLRRIGELQAFGQFLHSL